MKGGVTASGADQAIGTFWDVGPGIRMYMSFLDKPKSEIFIFISASNLQRDIDNGLLVD